ncbi:hypothetical protein BCON_0037g00090 [Botryotinia convoluta]|uniref:Uncharacterized protein n=1 Tax=Botryotinia convoluta TaxID=54673 RepID=A0A4Z1IF10_9HELO|nr:hypothetical protein BCON_0037g00090 [Botryotinia convoluta]
MTDINDDSSMHVSGKYSIESTSLTHWIEMRIEDEGKGTSKRFMVNKEFLVQKARFLTDVLVRKGKSWEVDVFGD